MIEVISTQEGLETINDRLIQCEIKLKRAKDFFKKLKGSNRLKFNKKIVAIEEEINYYNFCKSIAVDKNES